ncbi:RagB/SusD family nutrient uptake outer membrane protein [Sphingobacterium faecale]|uniref:RagB/SusD family nutrient uptake outer membrane protein n=1 Tax=Sphingobacterium faecale TaxID=2803775 RepID=A0ABS1R7U0_9SPHI|nr:RagB/SusD family nutrient uptake outer membrane protein [Sphingobacterium faecale]MBL1410365.1 RagB/SusD family nutrient uptake outer membrane protein [Sphingobacterium faecale]
MKKHNYLIYIIASIFILSGCSNFLEVEPKSSVSDQNLYSDEAGFKQGLTGVYVNMALPQLYGDYLTMGVLSAMAQNYSLSTLHSYYNTSNFLYANNAYMRDIWNKGYFSIATINNMLSYIDQSKSVFSDNNYNLIKGEALGIRAYLHFDLLRLFGPRFETGENQKAIPYRKNFDTNTEPALTTNEICSLALADLAEATELLKNDPIKDGSAARKNKMNFYAVLATKARILQYINKPLEAKAVAEQILNDGKFNFVKPAVITTSDVKIKDRLFSDELIFALRVYDMERWVKTGLGGYNVYFYEGTNPSNRMTRSIANFRTLYESTVANETKDYRFKNLIEVDGATYFPSKYWQTWAGASGSYRLDQMVPLFRLSELYYIMAEGASTIQESLSYLNTVRKNRGLITDLTTQTISTKELLRAEITKEYQKEFYAEGQTFFYYKRIGAPTMLFRSAAIQPQNYKVDIPLTELEFNPTY